MCSAPRRLAGIHERGRTILGEAGSGKSSLVRGIAREAVDAGPTAQRLDLAWRSTRRARPYSFRHRGIEACLTSDWPW